MILGAWRFGLGAVAASAAWLAAGLAVADQPVDGALYFQQPATEVKSDIIAFHNGLLVVITAITLLVLALLVWVMVRYNRRTNPTPRRFSHNMLVEVVWTVVPVLILIGISVYSFPLLAKEERVFGGEDVPPAEVVTIKAVGQSWFWTYDYPDYGIEQLASNMLPEEQARAEGRPALLAVDQPIYVPVDTYVRLLVTSGGVIHSFAMPAFGVKEDAIPGRINEGWFKAERVGTFYGQCSELCGLRHAFMPIEIRVVTRPEFEAWIVQQGGSIPNPVSAEAPAPASAG